MPYPLPKSLQLIPQQPPLAIILTTGYCSAARASHGVEGDYKVLSIALFIALVTAMVYLYKINRSIKAKESQADTNVVHHANRKLHEEIAKHEITEELLRETQDYLQNIINSMPSILIGVDGSGKITHWNKAAQLETNIKHEKALGTSLFDNIDLQDINLALISKAINQNKAQRREGLQEGHGSNARYKDITIYPLSTSDVEGAVIRIDDITSRIRLENMIIQNEKMGSLGELAAGVAHEINNPLGVILQSIQNVQRRLSDALPANAETAKALGLELATINHYLEERKITAFIDNIKEAGERAAQIVTNMLEFSRSHNHQHEMINLSDLLNRSIDLALNSSRVNKNSAQYKLSIERNLPSNCPAIYGSAVEIQQVMLNLISNAYHAFGEKSFQKDTAEQSLAMEVNLTFTDTQAEIVVTDNGPGMDEWTKRHIFEPFFTTKEAGKGTGLGLSVSYFIVVEHHNGSIRVESSKGKGSQFIINLPLKNNNSQIY